MHSVSSKTEMSDKILGEVNRKSARMKIVKIACKNEQNVEETNKAS